jgi:hypothetical protein
MTHQPHPTTPEHRALVLAKLAELWAAAPHQRLGQLVLNLARTEVPGKDPWLDNLWNCADLDLVGAQDPMTPVDE